MELGALLQELVDQDGSDLYLAAGAVPSINKDGRLLHLQAAKKQRLEEVVAESFARQVMNPAQWESYEKTHEANLAYMDPAIGRFRVNAFRQRGSVAMVFRRVKMQIPTLRSLGLPPILREIALNDRGICLVTGPTGSGKSTSMASMLDYRNHVRSGHIVTIEDPIEFLYKHRRSIVTQRELGIDTFSFHEALKNTLRQAPQVICIGELRDAETVQFALHAAETGHLVFCTLHSTDAVVTVERILNFYPGDQREQVLHHIAMNLRAIISQRLVPKIGGGRACAIEILINTPRMQDLLKKGELGMIRQTLGLENSDGITSMDKTIYRLWKRSILSQEEALTAADSPNDMSIKMRGLGVDPNSSWEDLSTGWEMVAGDYDLPTGQTGGAKSYLAEGDASQDGPMMSDDNVPVSHQRFLGRSGPGIPVGGQTPATPVQPPPQPSRPLPNVVPLRASLPDESSSVLGPNFIAPATDVAVPPPGLSGGTSGRPGAPTPPARPQQQAPPIRVPNIPQPPPQRGPMMPPPGHGPGPGPAPRMPAPPGQGGGPGAQQGAPPNYRKPKIPDLELDYDDSPTDRGHPGGGKP